VVSYIDSTTTGNTALASSRAVPVPVGTVVDDVVVVRLSRWESINPAVTTPGAPWVARTQAVNGSGKIDTFLKRLTATDSGTYTFSWTGSMWTTGQATLYRGVDPAANLATVSLTSATNSGTAWPAMTLNGLADGALDWHGYSESGGTHTPPTSWTEVEDNDSDDSAYRIITAGNFTTSGGASSVSSSNIVSMLHLPAGSSGTTGTVAATQANNTASATGQLGYSGTVAAAQAANTASASGTVINPTTGTVAATQANQTSAASGKLGYSGSAAVTQASQTSTATGQLGYTGTVAAIQANQTASASGSYAPGGSFSGTVSVTQANQTAAATGKLGYSGTAAVTQAPQTAAGVGTVVNPVTGTAAVIQANQTSIAVGKLGYSGTVSVAQAGNTANAAGLVANPITGTAAPVQANQTAIATGQFAGLVTAGTASAAVGRAATASSASAQSARAAAASMTVPSATGG
jgi:hypothetical protein